MTEPAFDTLEAARRLEGADIQAEKAAAIVEVVNQSTRQLVTVERFDASVAALHARIDSVHSELSARIDSLHTKIDSVQAELLARMDSMRSELRVEFARSHVRTLIVVIAANALMLTVLGLILSRGAPITPPFGAP